MKSHPDRRGRTLLQCHAARESDLGPWDPPGPGSRDARIDLKLLAFRAQQALLHSTAARQRLLGLSPTLRPDLWAGTVQDGTARGFAVALEEAASLLPEDPRDGDPTAVLAAHPPDPLRGQILHGKDLRRRKDLLVTSAGPRVRFSRKEGLLLLDRDGGIRSQGFLRFEDRTDRGTLDGFAADPTERPRLFDPRFLQPVLHRQGPDLHALVLEGSLGRGRTGFPCRLALLGFPDEPFLRLTLRIDNPHPDHRLRARFLGLPRDHIRHRCTDVAEPIDGPHGGFVAFTLVRACGTLLVDGTAVPTPAAQCLGPITHHFQLGPPRGDDEPA